MLRYLSRLLKFLDKLLHAAVWYSYVPPARLVGLLRHRRQILSVWPETPVTLGPKIVLFMHFDKHGRVSQQLIEYLREFVKHGRSIVFITNAGKLTEPAMAQLQSICAAIIIRRNRGYDFGAWSDGIAHFKLPLAGTEELILANDSVFGPLRPIGELLGRLNYNQADVWGLTESWQYRYHLQSFFIAFGPAALAAPAFKKFWRQVRPVPAKSFIIKEYEIGISQAMIKAGLRCEALWPYEALIKLVDTRILENLLDVEESDVAKTDPVHATRKRQIMRVRGAKAKRIALNPTADLWRQLLMSGFPFIKRELLRKNPANVEDIGDWLDVAREQVGADIEPILRDLRLMLKDQAP
jgi:hypothetical protein